MVVFFFLSPYSSKWKCVTTTQAMRCVRCQCPFNRLYDSFYQSYIAVVFESEHCLNRYVFLFFSFPPFAFTIFYLSHIYIFCSFSKYLSLSTPIVIMMFIFSLSIPNKNWNFVLNCLRISYVAHQTVHCGWHIIAHIIANRCGYYSQCRLDIRASGILFNMNFYLKKELFQLIAEQQQQPKSYIRLRSDGSVTKKERHQLNVTQPWLLSLKNELNVWSDWYSFFFR